ncbi:hypothetical protein J7643_19105 [bacterium]|nr:hypothetical protein [bacterium]
MLTNNITGISLDGVLTRMLPAGPVAASNIATGVCVLVATADWGPDNKAVALGTFSDYVKQFGSYAKDADGLETDGYVQAWGYFAGGKKRRISGGGSDLRMIRVCGSSKAKASKAFYDGASTPAIVGTASARYYGAAGNGIQVKLEKDAEVFHLTVLPFDTMPPEVFKNLTIETAERAINGVSKYIVWEKGVSEQLPASVTAYLSGGDSGLGAMDADYVGQAGASPTGFELAKTVADVNFLVSGKLSSAIKTQMKAVADALYAQAIVGPDSKSQVPDDAIAEQLFDDWAVIYAFGYQEWLNPVSGMTQSVFPAGSIAGALCNAPYWASLSQCQLNGYMGPSMPLSEVDAERLAKKGIIPITAGSVCRKGSNTSSDESINQIEDFRIPVFLAKSLDATVKPLIAEPQVYDEATGQSDFFNDLTEACEQLLRLQPKEAVQSAYVDAHYEADLAEQNKAKVAVVVRQTAKANQIIVDVTAGRTALRVVPAGVNLITGA